MAKSPEEVFRELIEGVAAGGGPELADLYAEHTHVAHPFAPGRPEPIRSREQLREHFTHRPGDPPRPPRRVEAVVVHQTGDAEVIVGEFRYRFTPLGRRVTTSPASS